MTKGPRNSSKFPVNNQYFLGGSALDYKMGIANSFYSSQNLDFRTFPSQMTVLPQSRAITSNLQDLPLVMEQDLNGIRWAVGSKGYVYKIDTSDNVSNIAQLTEDGSAGLLYSQITDSLYMVGQTSVSLYGRCTATNPVFSSNQYAQSASVALGCVALFNTTTGNWDGQAGYRNNIISDSLGINSGITESNYKTLVTNTLTNTYTLPSTIIENNTNFCYFAPDIEPFYSVAVYVDAIGTGDWTLTMHDSMNNDLASKTITNADMVANSWNEFVFSSQVRAFVNASNVGYGPTYHFHLTSSVTGDTATVFTYNSSDLSGCNFLLFAYRLVKTNNTWHPTAFFTGGGVPLLCIGNGEYLSTYSFSNDANPSNSQWQRHALTFKPGEEVTSLTVNNQYLCIFTERRSTDANRNYQVGTLYLWDGSTTAPNVVITIPMGSPYGAYTMNNITYFICAGALYAWSQGVQIIKVRKLAYQNTDYMGAVDQTRVNPKGLTSRYNILMMGYPSFTTDPNIDYGIWSYGAVELTFPNSYGYSYSQSIAPSYINYSSSNNLQLGCVENFVDSLYSSWAYTDASSVTHYGLDVIDNSSPPATFFNWLSLIYDGSVVFKEKLAVRYKIYFEALPANCQLRAKYSIDRGTWEYSAYATEGATEIFLEMNNARFHEIQYGLEGTCTTNSLTPPVILSITMEVDPLEDEVDLLPNEV